MSLSPLDHARTLQSTRPDLFSEKEWLVSPEPFAISPAFAQELDKLGYRLSLFVRACNQLYFASVKGRQPRWIAELLDRGKPPELIELARARREALPQVIRPDLILTPEGVTIAELDSVPGGIGLTAWLAQAYHHPAHDLLGGSDGMLEGFRSITPEGAQIVVSQESATYRPEMEWLAGQLNHRFAPQKWEVRGDETGLCPTGDVYRFFELFDLPNLPVAPELKVAAANGTRVTPPFKPFLEEKLWFALFWLRPLRDFWRRELSERHFLKLQEVIPYTWLVDPTPLPPHAVLPRLEVNQWDEVAAFSQKERDLILKISGFSELAWGSRGVTMAADLPQHEWKKALQEALDSWEHHPYLLQRFHKGQLVRQRYLSRDGTLETMEGRVRLCPYYFVTPEKVTLGGALATICPPDKKLIHGMSDAILVPTAVAES